MRGADSASDNVNSFQYEKKVALSEKMSDMYWKNPDSVELRIMPIINSIIPPREARATPEDKKKRVLILWLLRRLISFDMLEESCFGSSFSSRIENKSL